MQGQQFASVAHHPRMQCNRFESTTIEPLADHQRSGPGFTIIIIHQQQLPSVTARPQSSCSSGWWPRCQWQYAQSSQPRPLIASEHALPERTQEWFEHDASSSPIVAPLAATALGHQDQSFETAQGEAELGVGHARLAVALRSKCTVQVGQVVHTQAQCVLLEDEELLSR